MDLIFLSNEKPLESLRRGIKGLDLHLYLITLDAELRNDSRRTVTEIISYSDFRRERMVVWVRLIEVKLQTSGQTEETNSTDTLMD